MKEITLLAIDLAKTVFHVCGINHTGRVVIRKRLNRKELSEFVVNCGTQCKIAMESCGSGHYWGRKFQSLGHQVCLISPQHVKPFRKSQKNDANDAEAIAEAAQRPTMRFVMIKTIEQQVGQTLVRVREQLIQERTAVVNQLHGLLLEYGIIAPRGVLKLYGFLQMLLQERTEELPLILREIVQEQLELLRTLNEKLKTYSRRVRALTQENELCRLAQTVPGIAEIGSLAFVSSVGNMSSFKNGRNFAAWLGLVPRQFTTGDKPRLGRITKNGDVYLRKTLVHGARSVLFHATKKTDPISLWAKELKARKGMNLATVALANKLARILFHVLTEKRPFQHVML